VVELPVNRPADLRDEAARATPLRRATDRTNA
jgi:hypothetical protein